MNGLKLLHRQQQANGIKAAYVFINERGQPFDPWALDVWLSGLAKPLGCPAMLRHSTGYALAARGMDTRRLQHFRGMTNTVRYGHVPGAVQAFGAASKADEINEIRRAEVP